MNFMQVTFTLDKTAEKLREKRFEQAQAYIDSECIRLMQPYVPVALPFWNNAGKLRDSAENPEHGVIEYTAPKARHDYYANVNHANGGNPQAQRMWFEFMKQESAGSILRGVVKIIGG